MYPVPRAKLKNVSYRNQSLQDILATCTIGMKVLSVQRTRDGDHNTRLTILVYHGKFHPEKYRYERRVQFYDRLKLEEILPQNYVAKPTTEETIFDLNVFHGYDFTEDDIEVIDGKITAVSSSLGYYSEGGDTENDLMWSSNADINMWSFVDIDYMWKPAFEFPSEDSMVGDTVTEKEFKDGFVEMMRAITRKIDSSQMGQPFGVAVLDKDGKISIDHVPITVQFNKPNW